MRSSLDISHNNFGLSLADKVVTTLEEFRTALDDTVNNLKNALDQIEQFKRAVEACLRLPPDLVDLTDEQVADLADAGVVVEPFN